MKNNELRFTLKDLEKKFNINHEAFDSEILSVNYEGNTGVIVLAKDLKEAKGWIFSAYNIIESIEFPESVDYIDIEIDKGVVLKGKLATPDGKMLIKNNKLLYVSLSSEENAVKIPEGVTEIANGLLNGNWDLKKVEFPDSLEKIGDSAFKNCNSLSTIKLPKKLTHIGDNAFENTKLGTLKIPNTVKHIGNYAFSNCDNLKQVTFSNEVEFLGESIFSGCPKINMFKGTYATSDGLYLIKDSVLIAASAQLTEINVPDGIVRIGNSAFLRHDKLQQITFPDSLRSIGESAFSYTNVTFELPQGLEEIGDKAFCNNDSIENIIIPDSIKKIGDGVFSHCPFLKKFEGKFASTDGYCLIIDGRLVSIARTPNAAIPVQIPLDVTVIGKEAFSINDMVSFSVELPSTLKTIKELAFFLCRIKGALNLPEGLITIERSAFFTSTIDEGHIVIPSTVQEIQNGAFQKMTTSGYSTSGNNTLIFELKSQSAPKLGKDVFDCKCKIILPQSAKSNYENAEGWKELSSKIEYK